MVQTERPVDFLPPSSDPDASVPNEKVERLLDVARAHLAVGRIRDPIGSNAVEAYQLVLEIDPQNKEAIEALRHIRTMTGGNR